MIKGNLTLDGILIETLKPYSRKKIIKICDTCNKELVVKFSDLMKSRSRKLIVKDFCRDCSRSLFIGENNPAKRKEVREKIGKAHRGKGKNFIINDGINSQLSLRKMVGDYIHIFDPISGKFIQEHRYNLEKYLNITLTNEQVIHHINGIKTDNEIPNLFICDTNSIHQLAHSSLETVAFNLVQSGFIKFDRNSGIYSPSGEIMECSYGFDNIAIKQKKNICKSRLDADTQSEIFRGFKVNIPLIASNMSTVINSEFLEKIINLGAFGFLHRALPENEYLFQVQELAKRIPNIPVSIGIGKSQYELGKKLINSGANIILIDIAHGYSDEVIDLGRKLKKEYPHIKMIVGNTANSDMMNEVDDFADAVKVGIAQGYACETKNTAGCTEKQFSCNMKFKELSKKLGLPIISDGGTREPADFTKAIASGANSVMAGSIFAACPESAAEIVNINDVNKKLYAGMASEYVQNLWKGGLKPGTCAEGGVRYIDLGLPVDKLLERYQGALRTGISYSGANNVKMFQDIVEFIKLS